MIPARYATLVFGLIVSGIMSCMVCGVATLRTLGLDSNFPAEWMSAWSFSWPVAFLAFLTVSPLVRRLVTVLVRSED